MRVAVLGLGGVGTAAARFLAAAGHQVVGFEQFRLDHDRGSSYGGSRIIRRVYPDPLYASLMEAAYPLWADLARESGEDLFLRCGGFFFGPEGDPEMERTEAALREVGVPYEALSRQAAAKRLPQFVLRDGEYGIWEPESGLLRASRCVQASARAARAAGAELREESRITALEPLPEGIRLTTERGTEIFDRVVITAGPWTETLLAPWVRLPLNVTRQQYAHFAVREGRFDPAAFPVWIDFGGLVYGFPEHQDAPGAKVADHHTGPVHDPNSPDREPWESENQKLQDYLRWRLPGLSDHVTFSKVCLYTVTPDEDFIIDRLPGEERIVFIGGLSGHGFKFTVLLGQIAARLAVGREPDYPLDRFRVDRFTA
jgi:sarcosine oxidase